MTHISPDPVSRAIERLISEIGIFADDREAEIKPDQLERLARAISVHLKAVQDIDAHNLREAQQDEDKKYTRYEDLPPPNPAERERLISRIRHHYDYVNAGDKAPKFS